MCGRESGEAGRAGRALRVGIGLAFGAVMAAVLAPGAQARQEREGVAESGSRAAAADSSSDAPTVADDGRVSWIVLPNAFYTPTTRVAGGLAGQVVFRPHPDRRPSTLGVVLTATQNEQVVSEVLVDHYAPGYRLSGKVNLTRWPDTFYGIGDGLPETAAETFTSRIFFVHLEVQRALGPGWRLGVQADLRHERFRETEPGGVLERGTVPGSATYRVAGLGLVIDRDTRDDVFWPRRGVFHRFSGMVYPGRFGSDFEMGKYALDLRVYRPAGPAALAVQAYGSFTAGTSPFQMLPLLGGPRLMRGYLGARNRDRHMLILQAELRAPVWWRFGAAAFGGVGDVAARPSGFRAGDLKWSGGAGLRFRLSRREKVHVRVDYGFGGNASKLYITVNEAI